MEKSPRMHTRSDKAIKRVFIDADAFVALYYDEDPHYNKAQEIRDAIWKLELATSYFVLGEATTVISQYTSVKEAVDFLENILLSGIVIFDLNNAVCRAGQEVFIRQTSKNFRFSDACNIALIREHEIDAIFSFDQHYKQNGITRVGFDE